MENIDNKQISGYNLSRQFFDFCRMNTGKITPNHIALYFYLIELCNSLSWPEKFSVPRVSTMGIIRILNHHTYTTVFNDLITWGFIQLIQKSTNQYTANIIKLCHVQIDHSTGHSTVYINKLLNYKHIISENIFSENFILNHWDRWLTYKQEQFNFKYKGEKTEKTAIKELHKLSDGDEKTAELIINKSITNGWKGLFNLKGGTNGNFSKTRGFLQLGGNRPVKSGKQGCGKLPTADEHERDTLEEFRKHKGIEINNK